MIRGIDVSKWNGKIDWAAVAKSGVQFAMIRAGIGASKGGFTLDPKVAANVNGAHAAGIKVGLYCYSYARSVAAASVEAEAMVSAIAKYKDKITYPVAYDIEEDAQALLGQSICTAMCNAFCEVVRRAGYTPIVYCSASWMQHNLLPGEVKADWWAAAWRSTDTITLPHTMWQYTDSGAVPGIAGNVDLDISYVDYAEMPSDAAQLPQEDDGENPVTLPPDEADSWAQEAWVKAFNKGIMDGTRPQDPVKREELALVLERLGLL